jgi:MATE family multidrug resistance protein
MTVSPSDIEITPDARPQEPVQVPAIVAPEKSPLRELLGIAAPTVATMTSYTLMQFVDKLIVSRIGPEPIYVGAQGTGGIAAFVPISIAMGVITVINTYVSQNLGAGKPERGPAYAWNGVYLGVVWALLLVPYGIALPWILGELPALLTQRQDPELVRLASSYGQILIFGAVITMSTRAFAHFFYGMHKANVVLVAGVVANVINLGLSYALVFGKFGLPKMGIAGSAVGTVIATAVELAIPLAIFLGPKLNALYRTRSAWRPSAEHMRDLLRIGWPGGLMFGNEMICWTYFMVFLVGQFGKVHSTAGWIAHQWMTLSFMPAVGLSVAVTATVGKAMGMRRPDIAAQRLYTGMKVALVYMGTCGLLFVLFRHQMIGVFIEGETSPEERATLIRLGSGMLIATACFQLADAVAMMVNGALRGAGDTVWPGVATIVLSWTLIVGGGQAIVRFAPQLESIGPWIAAAAYIVALCVTFYARFASGKWKKIDLVKRGASPASGH